MLPMKHLALVFAASLLASCGGYAPLYAPAAGASHVATQVSVGTVQMERIDEENVGQRRVAQVVSQRLRQDFAGSAAADVLTVSITEQANALALRRTKLVEREQLNLVGKVQLTSADGRALFATEVGASTAYNVETTPYSTESGKTFARLTAADNLAEEIIRRVALYYRQNPAPTAKPAP